MKHVILFICVLLPAVAFATQISVARWGGPGLNIDSSKVYLTSQDGSTCELRADAAAGEVEAAIDIRDANLSEIAASYAKKYGGRFAPVFFFGRSGREVPAAALIGIVTSLVQSQFGSTAIVEPLMKPKELKALPTRSLQLLQAYCALARESSAN